LNYLDVETLVSSRVERFMSSGEWQLTTSNDVLEQHAFETPDRIALVDGRRRVSYREYYDAVRALAAAFVELGVTRSDVIAIQLPNWVDFAIVVGAAVYAGIPFCQVHQAFRSKEVALVLKFTGASVMVVAEQFGGFDYLRMVEDLRGDAPALKTIAVVGDGVADRFFDVRAAMNRRSISPKIEEALRRRRPLGNDLARFAFTSGTTGDPKAVMHSHNTTLATVRSHVRDQAVKSASAFLLFLPVGLNWGISTTLQALVAGAKIVFMERFDAARALALIEEERITHIVTAPTSLIALIDAPELKDRDVSSLEVVITGGASCPVDVLRRARERLPARITEMYGMLESGAQARTRLDDDPIEVAGTVGRPCNGTEIRILDRDGNEVPQGSVGEVTCFGPAIMIGYYNNPAANAQAFTADGWFRTGDLGFFDASGRLTISGRKKEMIIRGGANVYPREIEEALFGHPDIVDAAVVGVAHPRLGETVVACVVPRENATLTFEDVTAYLAPRIAKYKLPERLVLLDQLPRNATGKIQRSELTRLATQRGPAWT
jgi:acyl-CoA synthetase (AMP-forming)/AMP-acid ligase II